MDTMILPVAQNLFTFFSYALLAVFAENTVFSRALGVSRLVKLVTDDTVSSPTFCMLLCAVQLISAPMGFFANEWLAQYSLRSYVRPLVFVLCSVVAFFIVLLLVITLFRTQHAKEIVAVLPMATFNCCVLGTMLLCSGQSYNFLQTMAFSLGAALGYMLAVYLVTEGQRVLQRETVPEAFRGLPVTLLYIGILTLAIYGFTGHMIAF